MTKHTHDCTRCIFLGHEDGRDVYLCDKGPGLTLIKRYGSEGHEYLSYPQKAEIAERGVRLGFRYKSEANQ